MNKSADRFLIYTGDSRVLYESGAEKMARVVAEALPEAIQMVEQKQYRKFSAPVRVYVCASLESFKAYGAPSGQEGGFVLNKRLFISPKPENTEERIPRVLTHELSHLHMEQQLGMFKWNSSVPVWFKEGLAVYVSNGGGAETVTEEQARQLLTRGRHFLPKNTGRLLFPERGSTYGLAPHMFYRQSAMFVAYLNQIDESKFQSFILAVEDGKSFANAFQTGYGINIEDAFQRFIGQTTKLNSDSVPNK